MLSVLNSRKPPAPSPSKNQATTGTPQSQESQEKVTTGGNPGKNSAKNTPKPGGGNAGANTAELQLVVALQEMHEISSSSSA
jgi:hypothetical protein